MVDEQVIGNLDQPVQPVQLLSVAQLVIFCPICGSRLGEQSQLHRHCRSPVVSVSIGRGNHRASEVRRAGRLVLSIHEKVGEVAYRRAIACPGLHRGLHAHQENLEQIRATALYKCHCGPAQQAEKKKIKPTQLRVIRNPAARDNTHAI
jgi:hypothetical protein